jgi:hypothetical protein
VSDYPPVDCLWSYGVFLLLYFKNVQFSILLKDIICVINIIYCDTGYSVSIFYMVCVET